MNSSLLQEFLPLLPNSKSMPTNINNTVIHWHMTNIQRISRILVWLFDQRRVSLCFCGFSQDPTPTSRSSASPRWQNKSDRNQPAGSVRTYLLYRWCIDVKSATRLHNVRPHQQRLRFSVTPDGESSKTSTSIPDWAETVPPPSGQQADESSGADQNPSEAAVKGTSSPNEQNTTKKTLESVTAS